MPRPLRSVPVLSTQSSPPPADRSDRRAAQDAVALGTVLRSFREGRSLTQERLGFAAHLSKNYVADLEGARRNPTMRVLNQLLDALHVTWSEFATAYDAARGQISRTEAALD